MRSVITGMRTQRKHVSHSWNGDGTLVSLLPTPLFKVGCTCASPAPTTSRSHFLVSHGSNLEKPPTVRLVHGSSLSHGPAMELGATTTVVDLGSLLELVSAVGLCAHRSLWEPGAGCVIATCVPWQYAAHPHASFRVQTQEALTNLDQQLTPDHQQQARAYAVRVDLAR